MGRDRLHATNAKRQQAWRDRHRPDPPPAPRAGKLQMPFPYFGGKASVAAVIWQRFGQVRHYLEPFCGTAAVLLGCPFPAAVETINDVDGHVVNVLRALQADPQGVARAAAYNVSELDLAARTPWLEQSAPTLTAQLEADPRFYDADVAGWWIWVMSTRMGSAGRARATCNTRQLPHLSHTGSGVHALGRSQDPTALRTLCRQLGRRLRRVRVTCGDWRRIVTRGILEGSGLPAGVLLDPPYRLEGRDRRLYTHETDLAAEVATWATAQGENPALRIALCGYIDDYDMPATWTTYRWQTRGGYAHLGTHGNGLQNREKECIWFSPGCLPPSTPEAPSTST